jgi:hypothetical protein
MSCKIATYVISCLTFNGAPYFGIDFSLAAGLARTVQTPPLNDSQCINHSLLIYFIASR